jgi:hypothetical protein
MQAFVEPIVVVMLSREESTELASERASTGSPSEEPTAAAS